ncbi:peptidase C14 caspase catalytic subunit p20, partial [Candidatus Thiomargarita nelsonii]
MKPLLIYCVIALLVSACVSNPRISTTPGKIVVPNNTPPMQPLSEREQESSSSIQATQDTRPSTSTQIALVIGNSQYEYRPLRNPTNDAEAMAKVLRKKGFEVILKTNLKYGDMKKTIRQFGQRLAASKGVGLFYFAGHGVQVKGENYLIPINNNHIIDEIDVQNSAIRLNEIVQRMEETKNRLNIMVLDACRDNPFKDGSLNRNLSRGLARAHVQADGMLIAFATSPNKTASDGLASGQNGLYTHHLLQAIQTPNLKIEDVFKQVHKAVKNASNGEQVPWYNASLSGDFCFGRCQAPTPPVAATPAALPLRHTSTTSSQVRHTSTTPSQVLRTLQTQSRVNSIALSPFHTPALTTNLLPLHSDCL